MINHGVHGVYINSSIVDEVYIVALPKTKQKTKKTVPLTRNSLHEKGYQIMEFVMMQSISEVFWWAHRKAHHIAPSQNVSSYCYHCLYFASLHYFGYNYI